MSASPIVQREHNPDGTFAKVSVVDRFWAKVNKTPDGCWLWIATIDRGGYGQFWLDGKFCGSHRVAYELHHGPIPEGLDLDHLCRVRHCINPDHLEPVTRRENLRRGEGFNGRQSRQTHCKHGHAFTPENTHIGKRGQRICRACHRANQRAYYSRKLLPTP